MTEWMKGRRAGIRGVDGDLGGTMRLGAYPAILARGSRVSEIYDGAAEISERHRHRYEVNTRYKGRLEQRGMRFLGMSPDGLLPEMIEYQEHPWFIGVPFTPSSSRGRSSRIRCSPRSSGRRWTRAGSV